MINLRFRAKVTLKAAEKLDFVNSFISMVVCIERQRVERVVVILHYNSDCHVISHEKVEMVGF